MSKIPERLMEELDNACRSCEMNSKEFWGEAITLIANAFLSGELDEALGVVGRGYADVVKKNPITYRIEGFIKSDEDLSDATDMPLITLSPSGIPVERKEGTGKEEKR